MVYPGAETLQAGGIPCSSPLSSCTEMRGASLRRKRSDGGRQSPRTQCWALRSESWPWLCSAPLLQHNLVHPQRGDTVPRPLAGFWNSWVWDRRHLWLFCGPFAGWGPWGGAPSQASLRRHVAHSRVPTARGEAGPQALLLSAAPPPSTLCFESPTPTLSSWAEPGLHASPGNHKSDLFFCDFFKGST